MDKIERFIEYLKECNNVVFFGGAGVSTESGIPDFRSKDGLYNQHDVRFDEYDPEYLLSNDCLFKKPEVFYEFYRQKMDTRNIEPNITHKALAELEKMGKLKAVITQNIDGLHQLAGSKKVYELHGTTKRNYCARCINQYSADYIFERSERVPKCPKCGGQIRPYVTLYGEQLPEDAVEGAIARIEEADMLIIGGTSLTVYPAASFIRYFRGKHIVVINRDPLSVKLNDESDIMINDSLGNVFGRVMDEIKVLQN